MGGREQGKGSGRVPILRGAPSAGMAGACHPDSQKPALSGKINTQAIKTPPNSDREEPHLTDVSVGRSSA